MVTVTTFFQFSQNLCANIYNVIGLQIKAKKKVKKKIKFENFFLLLFSLDFVLLNVFLLNQLVNDFGLLLMKEKKQKTKIIYLIIDSLKREKKLNKNKNSRQNLN